MINDLIKQSDEILLVKVLTINNGFTFEEGTTNYLISAEVIIKYKGSINQNDTLKFVIQCFEYLKDSNNNLVKEELKVKQEEQYIVYLSKSANQLNALNDLSISKNWELTDRWFSINTNDKYMSDYLLRLLQS